MKLVFALLLIGFATHAQKTQPRFEFKYNLVGPMSPYNYRWDNPQGAGIHIGIVL